LTSLDLSSLGWDDAFAADLPPGLLPGRVSRVDRTAATVLTSDGPVRATGSAPLLAAAGADPTAALCTGDWVGLVRWPDGRATVEALLPRRTAVVRGAVAPGSSQQHVLAANLDIAAAVEGLLPEPPPGRIERLLTLAWDSGATPLVVLTKADLVPDADEVAADVAAAAPGVDVLVVSATTGAGLAGLAARIGRGTTLALLGPSGAGKSTLTNALAGTVRMQTRGLRVDGKGRHTTAHRELVALPGGGLVLDTPGLRGIALPDLDSDALEQVFADVEGYAAGCRFSDCAHVTEPGCAVLDAVAGGALPQRRLDSWRRLQREAQWMATRADARLAAEQRAAWKRVHAQMRRSGHRGR
jgi:ribosome biogenesis GTPase